MAAGEEPLDPSKMMSAGIAANVVTGLTSAEPVEVVAGEVVQETEEADLRK